MVRSVLDMVLDRQASEMNLPLEKDIQKCILDYLAVKGYVFFRNNTGAMKGSYKGKQWFMRFGSLGWPDIIGLTREGRFFGIEVKRPGKHPTDAQREVGNSICKSNGLYLVATSLDDVMSFGL